MVKFAGAGMAGSVTVLPGRMGVTLDRHVGRVTIDCGDGKPPYTIALSEPPE